MATATEPGGKPQRGQTPDNEDTLVWSVALLVSFLGVLSQPILFAAWNCIALQHCGYFGFQYSILEMIASPVYMPILTFSSLTTAAPFLFAPSISKERARRRAAELAQGRKDQ